MFSDKFRLTEYPLIVKVFFILFVLFYPMLTSLYIFLPLFVGVFGYLFIVGLEKTKISYILYGLIYFTNLEVNLSLPFLLILLSVFITYFVFYTFIQHLRQCPLCQAILLVLLINMTYLISLLVYDYIFLVANVVFDKLLLYSLFMDVLLVIIL